MRWFRLGIGVLACGVVVSNVACGGGSGSAGTIATVSPQLQTLRREKMLWERSEVKRYSLEVVRSGFEPAERIRTTVENGTVIESSMDPIGDRPLPEQVVRERAESLGKVESLFQRAETALQNPDLVVRIEYDGQYHYPAVIASSWRPELEIQDGGGVITVRTFSTRSSGLQQGQVRHK